MPQQCQYGRQLIAGQGGSSCKYCSDMLPGLACLVMREHEPSSFTTACLGHTAAIQLPETATTSHL